MPSAACALDHRCAAAKPCRDTLGADVSGAFAQYTRIVAKAVIVDKASRHMRIACEGPYSPAHAFMQAHSQCKTWCDVGNYHRKYAGDDGAQHVVRRFVGDRGTSVVGVTATTTMAKSPTRCAPTVTQEQHARVRAAISSAHGPFHGLCGAPSACHTQCPTIAPRDAE